MSSRRTRSVLAAASALSVFALTACSGGTSSDGGAQGGDGKVKVVASTDVWGSVVTAVGGQDVEVKSVIHDPSADPHSYETTADDALAAKGAQLLLSNGGGYDEFFGKLTEQASSAKQLVAYDIAATGDENEHVWYDLPGVGEVADRLAAQLGELKPAAKQRFADNATAFKAKVGTLEKRLEELGTTHPGTKVVVTEPVAHYLLTGAKITDATPKAFSDAVENDTDVPADAVSAYKQLLATKQVKALIDNEQTVTPLTQDVVKQAKEAGIGVVGVTETLPAGVTDYIGWMTGEVDELAGALK
ncbi:metal ABC transporter solute-binding protein, Zn/Mn family [Amycolatopsis sp. cmx-4-61]|uniref:metal ABC transporter solute-binding protein, Zn/Mn family n=1 Tax=Amycolatopsis sp. cmx-4-61 TaxID=2790937 RepID=UPI00397CBE25